MAWGFKFHPQAAKDLYKLAKKNKPLGKVITETHVAAILKEPYQAGNKKTGSLSRAYGYNFNFQGATYRIVYAIQPDFVRFIAFGVHDAAYSKAEGKI